MREELARLREWWDARARADEEDEADEVVNRRLCWREIERHLDGVRTILDVGGGTGAFSIPLAQRGYQVTHLDLSPAMLRRARENAGTLPNLRFVEGNAVDLSRFADHSFDLVLSLDGTVSFCGPAAERALAEAARVAGQTLVVTAFHRAWLIPIGTAASLEAAGRILPGVYELIEHGRWPRERSSDSGLLAEVVGPDYPGALRAYLPSELRDLLAFAGLHVERVGGLGSLANLCGVDTIRRVRQDPPLLDHFVALCDYFDRVIMPDGPGTRQRAGLIGVGHRGG